MSGERRICCPYCPVQGISEVLMRLHILRCAKKEAAEYEAAMAPPVPLRQSKRDDK